MDRRGSMPESSHAPADAALDAAIASLADAPPAFDAPVSRHTLSNGLEVFVLEDHRAPVVGHALWYRAGSLDESSGVTGIAHVLEHMMFNGTTRYGPGEYDQQMRALGAYANALTWTDYTAYTVEAPASRLADVMALEAERMTDLRITDAEFEREIRVVMEERRQSSDDDPAGLLYESLYASAFHASPQRWPIIGWMSDLESMRAEDARHWYENWYRPDNALLVVAGDVAPQAVFALAQRCFGGIAPAAPAVSAAPARRRAQHEPAQRGTRRIATRALVPAPQLALGFKVPRLSDPRADDDVYALAVLAELLDWGRVLETALVRRRRLADETWATYDYLAREPGLFIVGAVCAAEVTPTRVERGLRAAIATIARDGVTPGALQRVRTQLLSSRLYRSDSVFEQADELGRMAMLGLADDVRIIDARLAAVTPWQVQDVAARYFSDETMTVAVLLPSESTEDADEGQEDNEEEEEDEDGNDATAAERPPRHDDAPAGDAAARARPGRRDAR
ncbi:pitrilysin family protein [Robbsia sp. Bb-Pol-6]|uniref:Pitrilysin family protein n=1 Tax=Robbsia betulipollinis TaxID=2981849 RepID=A0ABT3ZMI5_9BURK|nr:pitrilysin family protein [Robbsia betulipollinis]MCY0387168.1 pitrilysin family protein [Robbsia betulipollinis]